MVSYLMVKVRVPHSHQEIKAKLWIDRKLPWLGKETSAELLHNNWLKETAEEQAALEHSANAVRVQCQKADQLVVSQAVTTQRPYGATRPDDGK
jgi:hypothetical protein